MRFSSVFTKLRTVLWFVKALVKRYPQFLLIGFSAGLAIFLATMAFYPFLTSLMQKPQSKRIALVGDYTPTDFPLKIQQLLSYGLTSLTPTGEATPAAASRWEVDKEGKVYTFHLKRDIFWQDGKPFTAKDVNYNLKDAEISLVDDFTIQIKLKEPFSPLPVYLTQPLFKPGLVGLGRYKVSRLELKEKKLARLTLIPVGEKTDLSTLQYRFYPSETEVVMAYKLGEVDIIEDLGDINSLVGWPVKVKEKLAQDRHVGTFYNLTDPFLALKPVRQALTYALPNFPSQTKATSPIHSPSWAYNENLKTYQFDPQVAKNLLKQSNGATGSALKKLVLSTTPTLKELGERVVDSWKNLGLETELKIENDVPREFQVLLATQEVPADPDQYSLWHSTQEKTNITHYKSPRIDKLLEDGRSLTDQEERRKKYLDFQKYLMDDVPAAFLYYPTLYTIARH